MVVSIEAQELGILNPSLRNVDTKFAEFLPEYVGHFESPQNPYGLRQVTAYLEDLQNQLKKLGEVSSPFDQLVREHLEKTIGDQLNSVYLGFGDKRADVVQILDSIFPDIKTSIKKNIIPSQKGDYVKNTILRKQNYHHPDHKDREGIEFLENIANIIYQDTLEIFEKFGIDIRKYKTRLEIGSVEETMSSHSALAGNYDYLEEVPRVSSKTVYLKEVKSENEPHLDFSSTGILGIHEITHHLQNSITKKLPVLSLRFTQDSNSLLGSIATTEATPIFSEYLMYQKILEESKAQTTLEGTQTLAGLVVGPTQMIDYARIYAAIICSEHGHDPRRKKIMKSKLENLEMSPWEIEELLQINPRAAPFILSDLRNLAGELMKNDRLDSFVENASEESKRDGTLMKTILTGNWHSKVYPKYLDYAKELLNI